MTNSQKNLLSYLLDTVQQFEIQDCDYPFLEFFSNKSFLLPCLKLSCLFCHEFGKTVTFQRLIKALPHLVNLYLKIKVSQCDEETEHFLAAQLAEYTIANCKKLATLNIENFGLFTNISYDSKKRCTL